MLIIIFKHNQLKLPFAVKATGFKQQISFLCKFKAHKLLMHLYQSALDQNKKLFPVHIEFCILIFFIQNCCIEAVAFITNRN